MNPIPFTAASAEEALAQIRARLGPEAIVLNVRRLPQNGIARLWQKPLIEVLAHVPEAPIVENAPLSETLEDFRQQLQEIRQQVESRPAPAELHDLSNDLETQHSGPSHSQRPQIDTISTDATVPASFMPKSGMAALSSIKDDSELNSGGWRIGPLLSKGGLAPLHAQQVIDELHVRFGQTPPASIGEEIAFAREVLKSWWKKPAPLARKSLHILIGSAGSGKTTSLCKWLTQTVLMEGLTAKVWRLDSSTANTAESLSVYCDILGVQTERAWEPGAGGFTEDIGFIDLPGIDWRNPLAVKELAGQIKQFGSPIIHLAINGAYDTSILLNQLRVFSAFSIQDLVITHLDEETRWGKIWSVILGTNYSVRYFSTGQNIPGDFHAATPEMVLARQFPCK